MSDHSDYYSANKIEDYLFLGDFEAMTSKKFMKEFDIKIVVSVIYQSVDNCHKQEAVEYHNFLAEDSENQDLLTIFENTNGIISYGQHSKKNVLVHCMAGISRSSTIVIAYLMWKYGMKFSKAIDFVRQKRPMISPNSGFIRQLILYEELGCILNPNNSQLRRYLIQNLLSYEYSSGLCFNNYFDRKQYLESLRKVEYGRPYICFTPNCGFVMFNQIHLIGLKSQGPNDCSKLFVEPLDWMKPLLNQLSEKTPVDCSLKCPKCKEVVAVFNENFKSFKCDCSLHKGLERLHFEMSVKFNKI